MIIKAILRYIYLYKSNAFSILKEMKFDGSDQWKKKRIRLA
jgi:hypothetical protein